MTPQKKPDWFELADSDVTLIKPVVRKRKSIIFGATAVMVAFGSVFAAQSPEATPAIASEPAIVAVAHQEATAGSAKPLIAKPLIAKPLSVQTSTTSKYQAIALPKTVAEDGESDNDEPEIEDGESDNDEPEDD